MVNLSTSSSRRRSHMQKHFTTCRHTSLLKATHLVPEQTPEPHSILTGGICLDIDDVALGPVCTTLIRKGDQGLHEDGILGPGLETPHEPPGVALGLGVIGPHRRVDVHNCPAVGSTRILPIKLRHILVRAFKVKEKTVTIFGYHSEDQRWDQGNYTLWAYIFSLTALCHKESSMATAKEKRTTSTDSSMIIFNSSD